MEASGTYSSVCVSSSEDSLTKAKGIRTSIQGGPDPFVFGQLGLSLGSAAATHDRPDINQLLASDDVIPVVAIRTHIEIAAIDLKLVADLHLAIGVLPFQSAILRTLIPDLQPRHSFHHVCRACHSLVAVIDGREILMALAVNSREHRKCTSEVRILRSGFDFPPMAKYPVSMNT